MDKKSSRIRRSRKTRARIKDKGITRLTIHKTPRHIYAQVISADGANVLASASTLDKAVRSELSGATGNVISAVAVGKVVAERAKAAGVEIVAFDRSGFRYHGRVQALANAARENGLQF